MIKGYRFIFFACFVFVVTSFDLQAQDPAPGENEFRLAAVNPRAGAGEDTLTSDAGRGIHVAHDPDLDGDGFPEIIVTEYTNGGRVFVYEMTGDNTMEFVWASPKLSATGRGGGGSTPRMITTGDFDNNGMREIIFPIGYFASDSAEAATMGIYFFEHTGNDNDYGTAPAYRLQYENIDPLFVGQNTGRTENGLRVQDIDGDGRSELLFPPRSFNFGIAKLFIMQVTSGTFSAQNAVVETEYVYEEMVLALPPTDGYVPVNTEIADVDGDNFDEIIVTGWTNISQGAGIGFIQIDGPDSYTPGSVVPLSTFNAFNVKSSPLFTHVNDEPVIYLPASNGSTSRIWVIDGIISDAFVTTANISTIASGIGHFSIAALGDQDHPTDAVGDGLDLYLYGGGGRFLDFEYSGTGDVTDSSNYSVTQLYDLDDLYDNFGGLFNEIYTYPGMDLDNDGLRDIVAGYKGSGLDTLSGVDVTKNGFHIFFFEWGDSATSIIPSVVSGIDDGFTIITPDDYELAQNYPNPFNPSTTIEFTLPINKAISLKVYNTLGQEVKTLISSQPYAAGTHQTQWDGTNNNGQQVASGVYIYQLKFGNFTKSKRMTLIR